VLLVLGLMIVTNKSITECNTEVNADHVMDYNKLMTASHNSQGTLAVMGNVQCSSYNGLHIQADES